MKREEIGRCHGIVVGTPVHWSNLSAETRRFLDQVGAALRAAKTNGDGRTAGAFCTGGGPAMGKEAARMSILSALLTMRFMVVVGVDSEGFGTLGPEATTGPADPGVSEKEQEEARRFGERFARLTCQARIPPVGRSLGPRRTPWFGCGGPGGRRMSAAGAFRAGPKRACASPTDKRGQHSG